MKNIGILVIFLGLIMTTLTGFSIVKRKKVVDLASMQVTRQHQTPVYWSPVTGGVLVIAGVVLLTAGTGRRKI